MLSLYDEHAYHKKYYYCTIVQYGVWYPTSHAEHLHSPCTYYVNVRFRVLTGQTSPRKTATVRSSTHEEEISGADATRHLRPQNRRSLYAVTSDHHGLTVNNFNREVSQSHERR